MSDPVEHRLCPHSHSFTRCHIPEQETAEAQSEETAAAGGGDDLSDDECVESDDERGAESSPALHVSVAQL